MNPLTLLRWPRPGRRALLVAWRNSDVYVGSWRSTFLPPLMEPALYLAAVGFGLGLFVDQVEGHPYAIWFGPALMASTGMFTAFFETAYGSFIRMYYQKTYDAITATPVSLEDVILGELLWGAAKSAINAIAVLLILFLFRVPQSPWILAAPAVVFVAAFSFGAMGLLTTSLAPSFDAFNFPQFLVITPMFFLSGTFIPLSVLGDSPSILWAAYALPLTHAVAVCRDLSLGTFGWTDVASLAWLLFVGVAMSVFAINSMKRRLLK